MKRLASRSTKMEFVAGLARRLPRAPRRSASAECLVGTEFGGRQLQYDMFYSAAQHVADMRLFRWYDWTKARALTDRLLRAY